MQALWLTACLAGACHVLPIAPEPSVGVIGGVHGLAPDLHAAPFSALACHSAAPSVVAAWTAEHPGWRVARWRCGADERRS